MAGFIGKINEFPRTFWIANSMELFERWAWYGMFAVLALYFTGSRDAGALGFSQEQKGLLMGTVVGILYLLPIITGAIADYFGYKKVLLVSYFIMAVAYFLMGVFKSYYSIWMVFLLLAVGAGLFKPVVSATVSKTTKKDNAALGFGIFYMIVNIGAFIGPLVAGQFRKLDWFLVFAVSSAVIIINIFLLLLFYREPNHTKPKGSLADSIRQILKNIITSLTDIKLDIFLIIIVGFWTMYNQLFYMLPVYIDQWVNTQTIYDGLYALSPALADFLGDGKGGILPEYIMNLDALYIILFQVIISGLVLRLKPLHSIISGFLVCTLGIGLWFVSQNGVYLFFTILIFAVGEMASSPRILEYLGRIAPENKVAMYMGAYYISMAGGNFLAGYISGTVYSNISDKYNLLREDLLAKSYDIPLISEEFTRNDLMDKAKEVLLMNEQEITSYLWNTYHPANIWMLLTGIGLLTVLALIFYNYIVFGNHKK